MKSLLNRSSYLILFGFGFLVYVLILFPGFMSHDSANQLVEARDGIFSDWHPPAMALLWRWLDKLLPGPSGMLFGQLAALWVGVLLVFLNVTTVGVRDRALSAVGFLCIMYYPLIFGSAGVIQKDVWMLAMLLIAFGYAVRSYSNHEEVRSKDWISPICCIIFCALAMLFRHNAMFALPPLIALAVYRRCTFTRNPVGAVFASIVVVILLFFGTSKINDGLTTVKTYPWVANAAFDTSGVIVRLDDHAEKLILFRKLSVILGSNEEFESLSSAYSAMYWKSIFKGTPPPFSKPEGAIGEYILGFSSLPDESRAQLRKLWLETALNHPVEWIEHRADVSCYLFGVCEGGAWTIAMMTTDDFPDYFSGIEPLRKSSSLQKALEWRINSLGDIILFTPAFHFTLCLALLLFMLISRRNNNYCTISIAASGVFYQVGLIVFAPSPDFRYSHYMIFCSLLTLLLCARFEILSRVKGSASV